jgi:hypothetical protein
MEGIIVSLRKNNGQMRVIEAILASFVLISALTFVNFFALAPTNQKYEVTDLENIGYNALHDLDVQGLLSNFIYRDDGWISLKAALSVTLPTDVYYNITIYDINKNAINDVLVSYGQPELFETSPTVSSINYATIGLSNFNSSSYNYEPRIINIQLVRG